ncbi:MAG: PilZ domain-containing protein [Qipengyuania sp.]
MSAVDTRNIDRDSLFLMAQLSLAGQSEPKRIKVRNLSAGGMMAEGDVEVVRGARVTVELRNIGKVKGNVAWVEANRFGVAFEQQIDPKLARAPLNHNPDNTDVPRYVRPALDLPAHDPDWNLEVRKI